VRFDAPEHVHLWQKTGQYPLIHDPIVDYVRGAVSPNDGPILDLCSSTGLLGARLYELGYTVCAVQEPNGALQFGYKAGVYRGVPLLEARIDADSLPAFLHYVSEQDVETVVARRAFPELWDALGGRTGFGLLAAGLQAAGVERIVLEGRAPTRKATHPLATAAAEAAALVGHGWRLAGTAGHVRELAAVPSIGYATE